MWNSRIRWQAISPIHQANVFFAHARKHELSLAASLFEQNIPVEVFHNLINTFKKHLPVWHRYFEIKRKALGQRVSPITICGRR